MTGLSRNGYFALSGAWVRYTDVAWEYGDFSWGRSKHVPTASLDIDLGASPPFLSNGPALFEVRQVTEKPDGVYVLRMVFRQTYAADRELELVIHLIEAGSLWLEPNGLLGQGKDVVFRKLDGPKKGT